MKILYKDKNTVVIYKPSGISSQPDTTGADDALTLTARRLSDLGEKSTLYPVHRLDKVVSGVLVFARNREAAAGLSALVSGEGIGKEYLAVVDGQSPSGVLTDYIAKDSRQNKAVIYPTAEASDSVAPKKEIPRDAKLARLTVTPIATANVQKGIKTLVKVKLDTGRFHQIRAQLSHRGSPITGDSKYGSRDYKTRIPALTSVRIFFTLGFETVDVICPPDTEAYPWNLFSAENYIP